MRRLPCISLPQIVDRRRDFRDDLPLAELSPGEFAWENPYAWRIEYRCHYEAGQIDGRLRGRAMGGRTERDALIRLQKLLGGFSVITIELWHIRPPMTLRQIEYVADLNRQLERIKHESNHTGPHRVGSGPLGQRPQDAGPDPDAGGAVHSQG